MSNKTHTKVAMIGIDAGDLNFIQRFAHRLPTLQRLMRDGKMQSLDTTAGLLPGSVWPTFYTETLPGEHGIYHHIQWDAANMRMRRVAEDWLYCEPFWYDMCVRNYRVCALDVPMTFPSTLDADLGVEVINWGAHDQLCAYQSNKAGLARDIRRRFGPHPMGPEIPVDKTASQLERIRDNLVAGAARKGELVRWLMEDRDWDFFLTVFGECHRGGHILWPEEDPNSVIPEDALLDVYRAVDNALGNVIAGIDLENTALIVFSLHGMQTNLSQEHFVPPLMDAINAGFNGTGTANSAGAPKQLSPMRILRQWVPARLQHAIAQAVPVGVRDWVVSRATDGGYDWPKTPGIALLADMNGYLNFNLKQREAKGALDEDGYTHRRYLEWLVSNLRDLRVAATGEAVVEDVISTATRCAGARAHHLPDMVVTWQPVEPVDEASSPRLGTLRASLATGRSGNHRSEGFCAVLNPHPELGTLPPIRHISELAGLATYILANAGRS